MDPTLKRIDGYVAGLSHLILAIISQIKKASEHAINFYDVPVRVLVEELLDPFDDIKTGATDGASGSILHNLSVFGTGETSELRVISAFPQDHIKFPNLCIANSVD